MLRVRVGEATNCQVGIANGLYFFYVILACYGIKFFETGVEFLNQSFRFHSSGGFGEVDKVGKEDSDIVEVSGGG